MEQSFTNSFPTDFFEVLYGTSKEVSELWCNTTSQSSTWERYLAEIKFLRSKKKYKKMLEVYDSNLSEHMANGEQNDLPDASEWLAIRGESVWHASKGTFMWAVTQGNNQRPATQEVKQRITTKDDISVSATKEVDSECGFQCYGDSYGKKNYSLWCDKHYKASKNKEIAINHLYFNQNYNQIDPCPNAYHIPPLKIPLMNPENEIRPINTHKKISPIKSNETNPMSLQNKISHGYHLHETFPNYVPSINTPSHETTYELYTKNQRYPYPRTEPINGPHGMIETDLTSRVTTFLQTSKEDLSELKAHEYTNNYSLPSDHFNGSNYLCQPATQIRVQLSTTSSRNVINCQTRINSLNKNLESNNSSCSPVYGIIPQQFNLAETRVEKLRRFVLSAFNNLNYNLKTFYKSHWVNKEEIFHIKFIRRHLFVHLMESKESYALKSLVCEDFNKEVELYYVLKLFKRYMNINVKCTFDGVPDCTNFETTDCIRNLLMIFSGDSPFMVSALVNFLGMDQFEEAKYVLETFKNRRGRLFFLQFGQFLINLNNHCSTDMLLRNSIECNFLTDKKFIMSVAVMINILADNLLNKFSTGYFLFRFNERHSHFFRFKINCYDQFLKDDFESKFQEYVKKYFQISFETSTYSSEKVTNYCTQAVQDVIDSFKKDHPDQYWLFGNLANLERYLAVKLSDVICKDLPVANHVDMVQICLLSLTDFLLLHHWIKFDCKCANESIRTALIEFIK